MDYHTLIWLCKRIKLVLSKLDSFRVILKYSTLGFQLNSKHITIVNLIKLEKDNCKYVWLFKTEASFAH